MSADFLRRIDALEALLRAQQQRMVWAEERLRKLEEKRGPGRPPKQQAPLYDNRIA